MLAIGSDLQMRLKRGEKSALVYRGLVCQSACVKLMHAIGLAETQGMSALRAYMIKLDEEAIPQKGSKATKEIVATEEFKEASKIVRTSRVEHLKIPRLMEMVSKKIEENPDGKIMVFTQYRDTCDMLVEKLSRVKDARVTKLIGQSKGGLKQKEQIKLLEDFRNGIYNVLVSTSVGEEGLDIASTDMVVFYEPIPSEIRTIQRRGRTGRKDIGEVYVLVAKGTRDEIFEKTSEKKEQLMKENLKKVNEVLMKRDPSVSKKQLRIDQF
jgi:Fanconi anemia group M protein